MLVLPHTSLAIICEGATGPELWQTKCQLVKMFLLCAWKRPARGSGGMPPPELFLDFGALIFILVQSEG